MLSAGAARRRAAPSGPSVSMNNYTESSSTAFENAVCNIKVDNDGSVYVSNDTGGYGAAAEVWLDSGLNSEVWVERTINSGSLDTDTIGASRVAMTADRTVGVTDSDGGGSSATANVTLDFYDAASGGNLLDSADLDLTAQRLDL